MTMTLSGDGTITGLVAGGLPNATVTADDLAAGAALNSVSDGVFFRNRIINGDMRIDQRNAGAAVTASNAFPVDRFLVFNGTDGAFSAQQDSSAPDGFISSLKWTATTADGTLTTTQQTSVQQRIEGTNVADLGWGTASAKTITLSFWVRSSLTGTFGGALSNSAFNRSYPFTYAISTADTWEQKSITIPGDTSGTWLKTTGTGINLFFGLGAGPDRSGTAGAWAGALYVSATGAVSVIGTLNATWYITGVQLEVGSVATPFERRPYGTELSLCQRYFTSNFAVGVAPSQGGSGDNRCAIATIFNSTAWQSSELAFKVSMRASPSIVFYRPNFISTNGYWGIYPMAWGTGDEPTATNVNQDRLTVGGVISGSADGNSHILSGYFTASAEL